jgi:flagellar protein FliL
MARDMDEYEDMPEERGPSRLMVILVIANLVLTLGLGGFVAFDFFTRPDSLAMPAAGGGGETGADAMVPPEPVATYEFEPFIVNLMDAANIRYVKVKMEVELSTADLLPEIEEKMPALQDMVIGMLSNRSYSELLGVRGKTQLREELLRRMNQTLTTGDVTRIYFTEFVVQ